jgi:AcrR family transcriptional regulator
MLEAVGAHGYNAASVRTVLDRTGLYRQVFYDNFTDKDACYLEALDVGVARIESLLAAAAAGQDGWQTKLRACLTALLDFLDAEPEVGRALIVEVYAAGPQALARRAEAMARIAGFVDLARMEVNGDGPPQIASEGIVAGIHAVLHSKLTTMRGGRFRELLPELMYFAVLPYFGAEAASSEMKAAAPG